MRTIALSLTLLALPVVPAGAENPAAATKIHKVFDIVRGNDKIGTDTIDIERQNDTTTIKCVLVFCLYRPTRLNPDSVRTAMMFE
jgi:hypothetical protein